MTMQAFFQIHPAAAVAFSGGVDSAWLLHEAVRYAQKTAAYFVRTPFQPAFELDDARRTSRLLGAALTVVDFDILAIPEAASNPPDRCYHCKRALFSRILAQARADGFDHVLDGGNASDNASDRPGMRALRELGVLSPLRLCGLAKSDIRRLAREAGIPVWDKPSYACLATRIPAGTPITQADLARVERGEGKLTALGFADPRLRLRGEDALLQVRPEQLEEARERLAEIAELLAGEARRLELDPAGRESREV